MGTTPPECLCYWTIWGISLHALAFFFARESQGGSAGLHMDIGRLVDVLISFSMHMASWGTILIDAVKKTKTVQWAEKLEAQKCYRMLTPFLSDETLSHL